MHLVPPFLRVYMKTSAKLITTILVGLAVICSAWLFEANDERFIVGMVGIAIIAVGGLYFSLKAILDEVEQTNNTNN